MRACSRAIPLAELRILTSTSVLAVDMAICGFAAEGFTALIEAESRIKRDTGSPWCDELLALYGRTLHDFAERYRVARE